MNRKDLENLVGESMEDMGLVEACEENECMDCGNIIEDGPDWINKNLCKGCWKRSVDE